MFGMKTIAIAAASLALATGAIQSANAAPRHGGGYGQQHHGANAGQMRFRIHNQSRRIRRGRRQGRLTWVEARRVRFELSHIRGFFARYMSDDHLNYREKRHLRRLLNRNSRRIHRLTHNRRNAWNDRTPWRKYRNVRRLSDYNGFR